MIVAQMKSTFRSNECAHGHQLGHHVHADGKYDDKTNDLGHSVGHSVPIRGGRSNENS
jgi:hypothetical protein